MAKQITLEVVTPERLVLSEVVDEVAVPGLGGELGILPEHTFLLSLLQPGVLSYRKGGERHLLAVRGGYVEVRPDRVTVLADAAERPEEIDVERARRARERALQDMRRSASEIEFLRAQARLQRALVRLQVAGKSPTGE
ncbi:MAG TPA: F0F1 ATP synthase subunit epsilon [Blastocatellia bacterium]|nr:F0F1 ATP synthase subunit epsilon [Blastocatellia bacterium]